MKKLIIGLLIFTPFFAQAESFYGFMDNKFYNIEGQLKVFGFMDGTFFNLEGQQVWNVNGEFTTTPPPQVAGTTTPFTITPVPQNSTVTITPPNPPIIQPTPQPSPQPTPVAVIPNFEVCDYSGCGSNFISVDVNTTIYVKSFKYHIENRSKYEAYWTIRVMDSIPNIGFPYLYKGIVPIGFKTSGEYTFVNNPYRNWIRYDVYSLQHLNNSLLTKSLEEFLENTGVYYVAAPTIKITEIVYRLPGEDIDRIWFKP